MIARPFLKNLISCLNLRGTIHPYSYSFFGLSDDFFAVYICVASA